MSEKKKLTLSVNKEIVDRAKELGINISGITESVLRGFVFTPKELDDEIIYKQYTELFDVMHPIMNKYKFNVEVAADTEFDDNGEHLYTNTITLEPNKLFWADMFETSFIDIRKISVNDFRQPMAILETFLAKMTTAVEDRREYIKEIEMAKRIVQAITNTVEAGSGTE